VRIVFVLGLLEEDPLQQDLPHHAVVAHIHRALHKILQIVVVEGEGVELVDGAGKGGGAHLRVGSQLAGLVL